MNADALQSLFSLSKCESAAVSDLQCKIDIIYWLETERRYKQQHIMSLVETFINLLFQVTMIVLLLACIGAHTQ
jgi:hypothetical protein